MPLSRPMPGRTKPAVRRQEWSLSRALQWTEADGPTCSTCLGEQGRGHLQNYDNSRSIGLMPTAGFRFFSALPPYLGGKRKLAPLMFAELGRVLAPDRWADTVLLDAFSGGGALSLFAKAAGFDVVASDVAEIP